MLFTESSPRATGRTRLVVLCVSVVLSALLLQFHPGLWATATQTGSEGGKGELSFHIRLMFASKDCCWLLFSEAMVAFKVVITNYSVWVEYWCILERGAVAGPKVLLSPCCPLLLLSHAYSTFIVLVFCSVWEQSLVPPLFCGLSLNQCCYRGSRVHGRMGCKKSFESYWTCGTR